jgi:hypothetical protein
MKYIWDINFYTMISGNNFKKFFKGFEDFEQGFETKCRAKVRLR